MVSDTDTLYNIPSSVLNLQHVFLCSFYMIFIVKICDFYNFPLFYQCLYRVQLITYVFPLSTLRVITHNIVDDIKYIQSLAHWGPSQYKDAILPA